MKILLPLKVKVSGQKQTWVKVKKKLFLNCTQVLINRSTFFSDRHTEVWLKGEMKQNGMAKAKHTFSAAITMTKCSTVEHTHTHTHTQNSRERD